MTLRVWIRVINRARALACSPTFTHNRVSCIELDGCVKILFNYLDQIQRCNSRLNLIESQLHASTYDLERSQYHVRCESSKSLSDKEAIKKHKDKLYFKGKGIDDANVIEGKRNR
jgi:hypothetical protein